MNARRGPARHAAARVLPGRRRDRDGPDAEDEEDFPADRGYELADPLPGPARGYSPPGPRAFVPGPRAYEQAEPRTHEQAGPHGSMQAEPRAYEQAEPRAYEQAGPRAYERAEPRAYERAEPRAYEQAEPRAYERAEPPPGATRRPVPPDEPVSRQDREAWLRQGQQQFDYLIGQGLQPGDRLLEIGCGSLAAGHLFIGYLSAGNYYGIDLSPEAVIGALETITEFSLQAKLPHVALVGDLTLGFLPPSKFTVVQADGLFSRSPIEVIGECLAHVSRVMTADAIFDFTFARAPGVFDRTAGGGAKALRADFHHRPDTLIGLAGSHGLDAELMPDWDQLGTPTLKLRVTRPG